MIHADTMGPPRLAPAGATILLLVLLMPLLQQAWADSAVALPATASPGASLTRPIKHASTLMANASNAERIVVDDACEARGISDIQSILRHSGFEEMWAYLPRAASTGGCQWHEIGRAEESGADGAYVHVDKQYLSTLMSQHDEVHLYHFHPQHYFECYVDTQCMAIAANLNAPGSFPRQLVSDLRFAMPSPNDIYFMMYVMSQFHQLHRANGRMTHWVITPYGVVSYQLTDAGMEKFDSEKHSRSQGMYIKWVAGSALDDDRIEAAIENNPGNVIAAVKQLAQGLNTRFLRLVYTPSPSAECATSASGRAHLGCH